jgi:hypothetical protein
MAKLWVFLHVLVLLAVIVVSLVMIAAHPSGAAELPALNAPGDFLQFWQEADLSLAQWSPDLTHIPGSQEVEFTGFGGLRCTARVRLPRQGPPYAGGVLHITATGRPSGPVPEDGLVHLFISWDPSRPEAAWQLDAGDGPRSCDLYRACLSARQALSLLAALPGLRPGRIAAIGEGIGGMEALALATMASDQVACVVGILLEGPNSRMVGLDANTRAVASYFDPANFARYVHAPVLLLGPEMGSMESAASAGSRWVAEKLAHISSGRPLLATDQASKAQLIPGPPRVESES